MKQLIQFKQTPILLTTLAILYFGILPVVRAVAPPPDGGYSGGNTAEGDFALFNLTHGTRNTAIGFQALNVLTTGGNNTAIGFLALNDNTTGRENTALGYSAGIFTTGDDNIVIGNVGVADESATIRIGTVESRGIRGFQRNTYIAGISGVTVAGGVAVIIDADGHLGSTTSSERFKDHIRPMDKASEAIFALKPVSFRYKHELDPTGLPQFGLVAEQVEKVDPALVLPDKEGKPYTVRYEAVNAMLLNEFLKEHRKVEELKKDFQATVAQQQNEIAALTATVKEQAAQIQKVSAQLAAASPSDGGLEVSRPAQQVVGNNQ